ncbi:MAG: four helix bundle protein, partial [Pyrinomonadaceae bacterium]
MNDEVKTKDLKLRTKQFALRVIRLCSSLVKVGPADVIGRQLVRSGTSVGAQYREAHRARSTAEFISKIECVIQELDETVYWLELLAEANLVPSAKLSSLQ